MTTINISHSPSAAVQEVVAPIRGVSISEFCRVDDLVMSTAPDQLLRVFIEVT
ncbi:hypothetical protein D3C81_2253410 [compost metagenome]